jgi:hypothetical protein
LLSVLVVLLINAIGCGKKEVEPVDKVYFGNALYMKPWNLPTLLDPSKSCYELWLVKFDFTIDEDSNAIRIVEDETSLGKFYWNTTAYEFYSLEGRPISDTFSVPGGRNVFDFNVVMITVEPLTDDGVRSNNGLIFYEITDPALPIHGQFDMFDRAAYDVVLEYEALDNSISAGFMLKTYSDDGIGSENSLSGLWFHGDTIRNNQHVIGQALYMPLIRPNANFVYEGWIVMEDSLPRPLSTGKFRNPNVQDLDNSHGGTEWYPNLPGEDFINNPPPGFTFPVNLVGDGKVYITFEPYPDPEPDKMFPFVLFDQLLPDDEHNFDNEFEMGSRYNKLPRFDAIVLTL